MTRLTLNDCIGLATWAHRNQLDKAGYPYIEHPLAVLKLTQDRGLPPFVQMAAVFHDTTEDTDFTPLMLKDLGLTPPAVDLVMLMDRKISEREFINIGNLKPDHEQTWDSYQRWKRARDIYYYQQLMAHSHEAIALKDCDMAHNSLPWRVSYLTPSEQEHNRQKYKFARDVFAGRITE